MSSINKILKITDNEEDRKAVINAITVAEGKSRERTMTFEELQDYIQRIENTLSNSLFMPKKYWSGLQFQVGDAADVPNSYTWKAMSTIATIAYKSGGWRLLSISRDQLYHDIKPINIKEDIFINKIKERIPLVVGKPSTWSS